MKLNTCFDVDINGNCAVGSIWVNEYTANQGNECDLNEEVGYDYYILTQFKEGTTMLYLAVSLNDGNRWEEPTDDIDYAVNGLTYVDNACITITGTTEV